MRRAVLAFMLGSGAVSAACSSDAPHTADTSCDDARAACDKRGLCWRLATTGNLNGGVSIDAAKQSGSANGNGDLTCNVECIACGTMDAGTVAEPSGMAPDDSALDAALSRWAFDDCNRDFACFPVWMQLYAGDEPYCRAQRETTIRWIASLPGSGVSEESLADCSKEMSKAGCSPDAYWVCVRGSRAIGQACATGEQCQSGWCSSTDFSCGVCVPEPAAGGFCSRGAECRAGEFCGNGTCQSLVADGEPCSDDALCGSASSCVASACAANARNAGETCGPEVNQPYCDQIAEELACSDKNVCQSVTFADPGEPCPSFGWCRGLGSCSQGVCTSGPGLGDACEPDVGCRWPAVCVAGRCVGVPDGDPCEQ